VESLKEAQPSGKIPMEVGPLRIRVEPNLINPIKKSLRKSHVVEGKKINII